MIRTDFVFLLFLLLASNVPAAGQAAEEVKTEIFEVKSAYYPPIALAARVSGDVMVNVSVKEGLVQSEEIVSGPPMLREAVINSIKASSFNCRSCSAQTYSLVVTYRFRAETGDCAGNYEPLPESQPQLLYPQVTHTQNTVNIVGRVVMLCDPAGSVKVRSIRCLYLWRCKLR
jgi:hypothetical protein